MIWMTVSALAAQGTASIPVDDSGAGNGINGQMLMDEMTFGPPQGVSTRP